MLHAPALAGEEEEFPAPVLWLWGAPVPGKAPGPGGDAAPAAPREQLWAGPMGWRVDWMGRSGKLKQILRVYLSLGSGEPERVYTQGGKGLKNKVEQDGTFTAACVNTA